MMGEDYDDMPEDARENEEEKVRGIEEYRLFPNKSMKLCEELRVVHMFLREATLTPFKQPPNYRRFKEHCMNIFHFVGFGRALSQRVIENAVRALAKRILTHCIQQILRDRVLSDREVKMMSKWVIKDYVEELSEMKMMQYIETICIARCKSIQNHQIVYFTADNIRMKKEKLH
jgi:hypothetical protein